MICLTVGLPALRSQTYTATLQGAVQDTTGAVVPGVKITLQNEATNVRQETRSTDRGAYIFLYVPAGEYRLTAEMTGFRTFVRSGIILQVQQRATVDVTLEPGELTTRIEVTGEAPRLNAVDGSLGRVVENKSLLDLPLGVTQLVGLTPGAVLMPSYQTLSNFVSNGTRNANADVLLDGVSVAIYDSNGGTVQPKWTPGKDTVQEFKVLTNSFSAEYGNSGGAVINFVLESGANQPHGRLFEYLSHYKLNANEFFSNRAGQKLNPSRNNNFGGMLGGPLFLPRLYDGRNRTFFLFSHEWTIAGSQNTTLTTVPTARQKSGDFSQTFTSTGVLMQIFDPFTTHPDPSGAGYLRDPFPGNRIPLARMDPVALKVVKYYPEPTSEGIPFTNQNNFFGQGTTATHASTGLFKLDHNPSERQRWSGRFGWSPSRLQQPNLWGAGNFMYPPTEAESVRRYTAAVDYMRILNPATTLNLRWGVFRYSEKRTTWGENHGLEEFGLKTPILAQLPAPFSIEGYSNVGNDVSNHLVWGADFHQLAGSLARVQGGHTWKAGAEIRPQRMNMAQPGVNRASFSFSRSITMENPFRTNSLQGNGLASFLLGWGSGSFMFDSPPAAFNTSLAFFLTDDIRLSPRLTLNLGLRYEYDTPYTERYNRLAWFDREVKAAISVPSYPNLRGGLRYTDADQRTNIDPDSNNLAPRFGFAYRLGSHAVIRGGYGIYYGQATASPTKFLATGYTGTVSWMSSLDSNLTLATPLSNPFPYGISPPPGRSKGLSTYVGGSLSTNGQQIRSWAVKPYFQQWSLSLQRELPFNSVFELSYSGSRGVHMSYGSLSELNLLDPQYLTLGDKLNSMVDNPFYGIITDPQMPLSVPKISLRQTLLPYPQYSSARGYWGPPIANSVYHSGIVQFNKRLSHGLSLGAHYTFSKLIDDNSYGGNNGWWGGNTPLQCYWDLRLERSLSVLDYRHRAVIDFTYSVPIGRGKALFGDWSRPLDWVLGGWQVNGILTFQSGKPLHSQLLGGILPSATQRPNLLRDPSLPGPVSERLDMYMDPNAFSRPAPYTLGNAPRTLGVPRAPGMRASNISLFKEFHWTETRFVQLRAEASNFTNTPVFGVPDTRVGSTGFGVISYTAAAPRSIQAGLKLYF